MENNLQIRQATKPNWPLIHTMVMEIFKATYGTGPEEVALIDEIRASRHYIPELDLVATIDGKMVGHALFAPFTTDGKRYDLILSLAPIWTVANHRGEGIGTKLMERGFEIGRRLGFKGIIVVGDPGYYSRCGFITSTEKGFLPAGKLAAELPSPTYLMIKELSAGSLEGCTGRIDYSIYECLR